MGGGRISQGRVGVGGTQTISVCSEKIKAPKKLGQEQLSVSKNWVKIGSGMT